jgi:hypothetical protein
MDTRHYRREIISFQPLTGKVTMRIVHILVALCLVPMGVAMAQSGSAQWPLDSGSQVRIQSPIFSGKTQQGTVVSTQADTLHFRAGFGMVSTAVGLHDITSIDVLEGTHSRKGKGALVGFALGAGIAAGIQAVTWKKTSGFDFGRGGDAAFMALPGGLVGGAIGLLVGAHKTENWVDVKLPRR